MRTILIALLALATPASARDLPVPPGKGWQHAETGLALTATLDGLPRTKLTDATGTEHDVVAEFGATDDVATIYLFHPAVHDVALWFERAEAALSARDLFGGVTPASAAPVAFAPPGSTVASAWRRVYIPAKGDYRSTALAVMPLGEWLVAVRASSRSDDATALDRRLDRVIAALRWPAQVPTAPAVVAIDPCPAGLTFRKAKVTKPDGGSLVMSLLGSMMAARTKQKGKQPEPHRWCRDPASTAMAGVYRDLPADKGYMLALGDAGRVVHVVPTLDAQLGKGDGYSVSLTDVDATTSSFGGFDHLPAPAQVLKLLEGPARSTSRGNNVTISADALAR